MAFYQSSAIYLLGAEADETDRLAMALSAAGYGIRRLSWDEGLMAMLQQPPALVVIEVGALDDGGYQLCRQMRSNPALGTIPVVLAGGAAALAHPALAFATGCDDYFKAPFEAAEVVARVEHQLRTGPRLSGAIAPDSLGSTSRPSLLQASLQRLHNSLDLDTVLQTAVADVREQTHADRVVIYQFRSNGRGEITHEAVARPELSVLHRRVEDACFDRDYAVNYWSGRVGRIDDVAALGSVNPCYRNMLLSFDIRANLVVPIIHNLMGQSRYLWGLVVLHQCDRPRQWQPEEIDLLQELSAHLAIAIQQSRLFGQVQRQARQEMLLNHILDEIRASLDVEHILTCTVDHLRLSLNLRQCGIALLQHNLPKLPVPFVVSGTDPTLPEPLPSLEITDSLRRQLLMDSDLRISPYLNHPIHVRAHQLQTVVQDQTTYVATALLTDGHVQGVLWACPNTAQIRWDEPQMGTWEHSDLRLIEEVAQQLSQALHQADLYQQLQAANEELQRLAHRDGLTQIANRREFDRYLEAEWQRLQREQGSLALVLADVDHFKGYNDAYGHLAGDDCLRAVGQLLETVTKRPADLAARYGGEEFALILPNTTPTGAIALVSEAQTHLNRLALPNRAAPLYRQVTLSFGIAVVVPNLALSPEVLKQRADLALYAAKRAGRNSYCLWTESLAASQSTAELDAAQDATDD